MGGVGFNFLQFLRKTEYFISPARLKHMNISAQLGLNFGKEYCFQPYHSALMEVKLVRPCCKLYHTLSGKQHKEGTSSSTMQRFVYALCYYMLSVYYEVLM